MKHEQAQSPADHRLGSGSTTDDLPGSAKTCHHWQVQLTDRVFFYGYRIAAPVVTG